MYSSKKLFNIAVHLLCYFFACFILVLIFRFSIEQYHIHKLNQLKATASFGELGGWFITADREIDVRKFVNHAAPHLKWLTWLRRNDLLILVFDGTNLNDEDLDTFEQFDFPFSLHLQDTRITEKGITTLARFQYLNGFSLDDHLRSSDTYQEYLQNREKVLEGDTPKLLRQSE